MKVVTITLTFMLTFFTSYLLVISFVFFIENIDSLLKTALKKNWYLGSKNVGRWDCNDKWNTDCIVLFWLRSSKDRSKCCIFSDISSFIGWKHLYWINCFTAGTEIFRTTMFTFWIASLAEAQKVDECMQSIILKQRRYHICCNPPKYLE